MIGNPRYRMIGIVTLPFYLLFEALGPVVELTGVLAVITGAALGLLNWPFVLLIALASLGYGMFLSIAAITVEELGFHRYLRWRDIGALLVASLVENLGFRQLHAWWRLGGLISGLRGKPAAWGVMPRTGFGPGPANAAADLASAGRRL